MRDRDLEKRQELVKEVQLLEPLPKERLETSHDLPLWQFSWLKMYKLLNWITFFFSLDTIIIVKFE